MSCTAVQAVAAPQGTITELYTALCAHCRKPTRQQISKRMMQICQKEGLQVNESTLEALVEGANSDIRLILGQLQMVRLSSRALSYDEVKVHDPVMLSAALLQ